MPRPTSNLELAGATPKIEPPATADLRTTRHTTTSATRVDCISPNTSKMSTVQSVQCFGKKKTATAVAHCKQGKGLIKVNGKPLSLVEPQILRFKVYEPVLLLGTDKFGEWRWEWMETRRMGELARIGGQAAWDQSNSAMSIPRTTANTPLPPAGVDIRVRVRGGGHTSQVYAIRQAIAKSIVRPP